jgi:very-short-patch-repair endonuclease
MKKLTTEQFIEKANIIHNNKYDYSKSVYVNSRTKLCIICPEHGEFWQTPNSHINSGDECSMCAHRSFKKTTEEFINEAIKIHGEKYDYSKVDYARKDKKVCIICPEHGEFWQTPHSHLSGSKCPICANKTNGLSKRLTLEEFVKKAREVHGDKYDYSQVDYKTTDTKVKIICPEHGEFLQSPHNHIGQKQGCPKCSKSHMEKEISQLLTENNIRFEEQKKFPWLKYKKPLALDFYLPEYDIVIECQGEQHFVKMRYITESDEKFKLTQKRDMIKKELCEEHGLRVLYYSTAFKSDFLISDKNKLLKEIRKCVV